MKHDENLELESIATFIEYSKALDEAMLSIKHDDFFNTDNSTLWRVITNMYNTGAKIDIISVSGEMKKIKPNWNNTLITIQPGVPGHTKSYISQLLEFSFRRKIKIASLKIHDIVESNATREKIMSDIDSVLFDIQTTNTTKKEVTIKQACEKAIRKMEKAALGEKGIQTGLKSFDALLIGFEPGDLCVIGARPSMGKTAFVFEICKNISVNIPVAVFSLEMPDTQLGQRYLASEANISFYKIRMGITGDNENNEIVKKTMESVKHKMFIKDLGIIQLTQLCAEIRIMNRKHGARVVMIDHLGFVENGEGDNRHKEINKITKTLKSLAKELDIIIILVSQLSKAVEQRSDKHPMMSDLRESGSIEEDADIVFFLYRDEYYYQDSEKKGILEILLEKNRNGPTGTVEMLFIKDRMQFVEIPSHGQVIEKDKKKKPEGGQMINF